MFDISWTEFLLIGVVALIVIGPKELPGVMRTMGQWTRKIRSMAGDFQNQFQEAMREAEMADLKKEVDDMAQGIKDGIKNYDPLKEVRENVESIGALGKDIAGSLDKPPEQEPVELKPDVAAIAEAATPDAGGDVVPALSAPVPESAAATADPGSSERTG
jgi:sec-independent protein translocase protein TatB